MRAIAIACLLGLAAAITKPEKTDPYNAWDSVKDGAEDGKYERKTTGHFSSDADDIFMRSMIEKYAKEARTDTEKLDDGTKIGGEPTGKFFMTKSTTLAAAKEVLNTHKGLSGPALGSYMDTYFEKAWAHFDVNQEGEVAVTMMPQFMRFVCSDQGMQLGESG